MIDPKIDVMIGEIMAVVGTIKVQPFQEPRSQDTLIEDQPSQNPQSQVCNPTLVADHGISKPNSPSKVKRNHLRRRRKLRRRKNYRRRNPKFLRGVMIG